MCWILDYSDEANCVSLTIITETFLSFVARWGQNQNIFISYYFRGLIFTPSKRFIFGLIHLQPPDWHRGSLRCDVSLLHRHLDHHGLHDLGYVCGIFFTIWNSVYFVKVTNHQIRICPISSGLEPHSNQQQQNLANGLTIRRVSRAANGEVVYPCDYCDRYFTNRHHLSSHMVWI